MTYNNDKVGQKAQSPRPVGSGQKDQVPTHEGSQLSSPQKAGNTVSKTPHL